MPFILPSQLHKIIGMDTHRPHLLENTVLDHANCLKLVQSASREALTEALEQQGQMIYDSETLADLQQAAITSLLAGEMTPHDLNSAISYHC
jgi:hypothetical protein